MSEDSRKLTCEEFQNQIADLVGSGVEVENYSAAIGPDGDGVIAARG